jgi:hypothetical protein
MEVSQFNYHGPWCRRVNSGRFGLRSPRNLFTRAPPLVIIKSNNQRTTAVVRQVCDSRWVRSAMPMTPPCARASRDPGMRIARGLLQSATPSPHRSDTSQRSNTNTGIMQQPSRRGPNRSLPVQDADRGEKRSVGLHRPAKVQLAMEPLDLDKSLSKTHPCELIC